MPKHDNLSNIVEGLELSKVFIQQASETAFLDLGIAKTPYPAQVEIFNSNHMIRALFGANQGGKCLSVNSQVLMSKGYTKPIRDVEVGDRVVAFDSKTKDFVDATVNGVFFNGQWMLHRFKHSEGILVCTRAHKVMTADPKTGRLQMLRVMRAVKQQYPVIVRSKNGCPILSRLEYLDEYKVEVTMDLGIDHPDHAFVAEGIVVSNSHTGGAQMAWDATGLYPDWYTGERTVRGINAWVMGDTTENTREACQKKLFGPDPDKPGWTDRPGIEGLISSKYIIGKPSKKSVSGAFDIVRVKHVPSDTVSIIGFKSHEMATQSLASWTGDRVWIDEECSKEILDEMIARITATKGKILITMCPLMGITPLVNFLINGPPDLVKLAKLDYDQAKHIDPKVKEANIRLWSSNPSVLAARTRGEATQNTGLIFPFDVKDIIYDPGRVKLSPYWDRLGGLDVGWTHPTAAVAIAFDRQSDVAYCYATYEQSERPALYHYSQLDRWGENMTFMIDPAAVQVKEGVRVLEQYWKYAHGDDWDLIAEDKRKFIKADNSFMPGVDALWHRFSSGRLKISQNLVDLLKQYNSYVWSKDGLYAADETPERKYDMITSLRYAIIDLEKYAHRLDQAPPWADSEYGFEDNRDVRDWKPFRAGGD